MPKLPALEPASLNYNLKKIWHEASMPFEYVSIIWHCSSDPRVRPSFFVSESCASDQDVVDGDVY